MLIVKDLFSIVKQNLDEHRSSMAVESVAALAATKVNLSNRGTKCYILNPSNEFLKKTKKATVKHLCK